MKQNTPIGKPRIDSLSLAAENILMLTVQQGAVEGGVQLPYEPLPGETLEQDKDIPALVYIVKEGKRVGVRVEDRQLGPRRFPYESLVGEALNLPLAESPEAYLVNGRHPLRVWRKTKPNGMADPDGGYTFLHVLYLVFSEPFRPGSTLCFCAAPGLFDRERIRLDFVPEKWVSQAIHTNQLGCRPDDPSKKAYLSQWMGLGGGIFYDHLKDFVLLDGENRPVFRGEIRRNHDGHIIPVGGDEISSLCPVYELDFSPFRGRGVYRVMVPELGCSLPIPMGDAEIWEKGFRASMNALYCQRSGIVTGPPYTQFRRPRVYHPDDGRVVYQSECSLFESGNGLNAYGTDFNNFGNLVRKATGQVVENAWGGYFDACDWDRRIQHLDTSLLQTELYLLFPDYFRALKLPIPESGSGIPDILSEALYNIDFYRRLQLPDGGIRGGIEAEEHPILGQCGWQDSWKAYAYAPDFWSSYYYAAAAARMAYALRPIAPEKAEIYRASAEAAFTWAERTYAAGLEAEGHKWTRQAHRETELAREKAACDLFRLTLDEKYGKIYLKLRKDTSYEAAFLYCTLPVGAGDEAVKRACREAILAAADRAVENGKQLPYHLTSENLASDYAGPWGHFVTVPRNVQLIRAHWLTGEEKYLASALAAADFALGANPDNLCYTTGVGVNWPRQVLHHDSRLTGQEPPVGITVCGPHDFHHPDDAIPKLLRADFLWPGAYAWPSFESYLDIYRHPCMTEYTVMESLGPNSYQWGYFAAREVIGHNSQTIPGVHVTSAGNARENKISL